MKVFIFALLLTTVLGFAISNMMLHTAEVNLRNCITYQRVIPVKSIKKSNKKWKSKISTRKKQSARRNLFRRHHQI